MSAYATKGKTSSSNSYQTFPHPSLPPPVSVHDQHQPLPTQSNLHEREHSPFRLHTDSLPVHSHSYSSVRNIIVAQPPSRNGYQSALNQNHSNSSCNNNGRSSEEQEKPRWKSAAQSPSGGDTQKGNRLRKACDSCSIRKVKCDESGPPCRACAALDIPCTFNRPSRRRGPPNRHSEAIKRKRLESPAGVPTCISSPQSLNNTPTPVATFSSHAVLSAESICPFSILELLVDDFFTYLYPFCPFPHEPSFRVAFMAREDLKNHSFLALLASMIGVLVLSLPRRPRLHFSSQQRGFIFPGSLDLADRCRKVAIEARGIGYLDKDLTIYDAVTSYFLGLASAYTFQWNQTRLYFGEALNITKIEDSHILENRTRPESPLSKIDGVIENSNSHHQTQTSYPKDYIKREIARRVFWVLFICIRSIQQFSNDLSDLLSLPTPNNPYPPLPLEVDDEYIFVDHVDPQPSECSSRLTGNILNVNIYTTVTPLVIMELTHGTQELFDWDRRKKLLGECLTNAKESLIHAPRELLFGPLSDLTTDYDYHEQFSSNCRESNETSQLYLKENLEAVKQLQFGVQKANIYASQVATRFYLIEKFWSQLEIYKRTQLKPQGLLKLGSSDISSIEADVNEDCKSPKYIGEDDCERKYLEEEESVIIDLLKIICSLNANKLEIYGESFRSKIRLVTSNVIEISQSRRVPLALKVENYLSRFLVTLAKLERIGPELRERENRIVIEEELRCWADIRECQMALSRIKTFF